MTELQNSISEIGVVPVIKLNHPQRDAVPLAKALCAGGVPVAEVTFRAEGNGWKLYALDSSGERIGEIPVKAGADGALTFRLSTIQEFGAVCAYELTR